MKAGVYTPTDEQARIVMHEGSAFIAACPGAGKTRVLVERARRVLGSQSGRRGVAFLSFTTGAISELEARLRREGLVASPAFPHFIGTFDAFLWQFLIAPFGVPGCAGRPRLIPDKDDRPIRPYPQARQFALGCFDRTTGQCIPEKLERQRFSGNMKAYETAARNMRIAFLKRGDVDFADAREIALNRLRNSELFEILSGAFAARFQEVIVDEAQDCNPVDLEIVGRLREAGIPVKMLCDPHQAIYGFRGGVTNELWTFSQTFADNDRLPMSGNFRSGRHITKAVSVLRAPSTRTVDEALGEHRDEPTPVHVISYRGTTAPETVGAEFRRLTEALRLDARKCPVVAATRRLAASALGYPSDNGVEDLSYRLAAAVSNYHHSFELGGRREALECLHKVFVEFEGHTSNRTYHQHIVDSGLAPEMWRPDMVKLAEALRFDPARFPTADAWLQYARNLLSPCLPSGGGRSVNQRLRNNADLPAVLTKAPPAGNPMRTIHSVKGMEFPAVCVVMSPRTSKGILDFLCGAGGMADNEDARKLYVGASRAQRLLVIAVPKSQANRLMSLLRSTGAGVELSPV